MLGNFLVSVTGTWIFINDIYYFQDFCLHLPQSGLFKFYIPAPCPTLNSSSGDFNSKTNAIHKSDVGQQTFQGISDCKETFCVVLHGAQEKGWTSLKLPMAKILQISKRPGIWLGKFPIQYVSRLFFKLIRCLGLKDDSYCAHCPAAFAQKPQLVLFPAKVRQNQGSTFFKWSASRANCLNFL